MGPVRDTIDVRYLIEFEAPFHLGTGLGGTIVDRFVRRDNDEFLMVPGSTIKGVVRENCERLAQLFGIEVVSPHVPSETGVGAGFLRRLRAKHDMVHSLFGSQFRPGTLFFDDAELTKECRKLFAVPTAAGKTMEKRYRMWQVENRTRVSMSRITGTARHGALFTSEYGNRGLAFQGRIYGHVEDIASLDEGTYALILLLAGLVMVESLGADRSSGCGRCRLTVTSLQLNGAAETVTDWLNRVEELQLYNDACEEEI